MFSPCIVFFSVFLYVGLLLFLAVYVERKTRQGVELTDSSLVYSLSLAVICTAWSFYGNIGNAAHSGMFFVSGHLGSSLCMLLSSSLLRKLVRIKEAHRLTSIADLISARYGKSEALAALVTLIGLIGLIPYIALQLKAVTSSFALVIGQSCSPGPPADAPGMVGPFVTSSTVSLSSSGSVREEHTRTAAWLFPLYLLLFNLFIFPIAMGGLLLGHARESAETFVLLLPMEYGPRWLSLLVFLGGLSAATGMIMLETVALSTMTSNHLILPIARRARRLEFLLKHLLKVRWAVAAGIVLSGYLYMIDLGRTFGLANLGQDRADLEGGDRAADRAG